MHTVGIRDVVLGSGACAAVSTGGGAELRRWASFGLISDGTDLVLGLRSRFLIGARSATIATLAPLPFVAAEILGSPVAVAARRHNRRGFRRTVVTRDLTTVLTTTATPVAVPATPPTRPFAADLAWLLRQPAPGSMGSASRGGGGVLVERLQAVGGHRLFTANDPEPTGIARLLSGVRDSQSGCRTMRNRQ
jgi:hypothetical protein